MYAALALHFGESHLQRNLGIYPGFGCERDLRQILPVDQVNHIVFVDVHNEFRANYRQAFVTLLQANVPVAQPVVLYPLDYGLGIRGLYQIGNRRHGSFFDTSLNDFARSAPVDSPQLTVKTVTLPVPDKYSIARLTSDSEDMRGHNERNKQRDEKKICSIHNNLTFPL